MTYKDRFIAKTVREVCEAEGIGYTEYADDWVMRLQKGDQTHYVFGYVFDLNPQSTTQIASDKYLTATFLREAGLATVDGEIFLHPRFTTFIDQAGVWSSLTTYAAQQSFPLVVKPNAGTAGQHVYKVHNMRELESAAYQIFQQDQHVLISPFYDIEEEYRCVYLDGEIRFVFSKQRPMVVGNGESTVLELLSQFLQEHQIANTSIVRHMMEDNSHHAMRVLQDGEECAIGWKHNLSHGSQAQLIETPDEVLVQLAQDAAQTIGARFCTVDIIQVVGGYKVLEINSGASFERFSSQNDEYRALAHDLYRDAVLKMFG